MRYITFYETINFFNYCLSYKFGIKVADKFVVLGFYSFFNLITGGIKDESKEKAFEGGRGFYPD